MSSQILSRLDILLSANSAELRQEMVNAAESSEENFEKIKSSAKKMAVGLAAAFSIKEAGEWINAQIDAAIAADNTAKAVGVSANKMAGMSLAVNKMGLDSGLAKDAMSGLNEKILAAGTQGGDAAAMFTALGINVKDASGHLKSADAVMAEIADKFHGMADGSTKAAMASELMGDAGAELIPVLNQGGSAIAANTAEVERLGLALDKNTIAAMRQFKSDTGATSAVLDSAKNKIIAGMMPALSAMSGGLRDVASDGSTVAAIGKTINFVFKGIAMGAAVVGAVFNYVGDRIGKFAAMAAAVASGDFKGAWSIFNDKSSYQAAVDAVSGAMSKISDIYNSTGAIAKETAEDIKKLNNDITVSNNLTAANAKPEKSSKLPKDKIGKNDAIKKKELYELEEGVDFIGKFDYSNTIDKQATDLGLDWDVGELEKYDQEQKNIQARHDKTLSLVKELTAADKTASQDRLATLRQEQLEKYALLYTGLNDRILSEEQAHQAGLALTKQYAEAEREERVKNWGIARDFYLSGLDAMAQGNNKAAKIARGIHKARSIIEITNNTAGAAIAAYKAMVGVPFIGPSLAIAAAAAAVAFGAAQIKALNSESMPTMGGAASVPSAAAIQPVSEQKQADPVPSTTVYIPPDTLFTGRQMVDLLNDALSDGKRLRGPIDFVGATA